MIALLTFIVVMVVTAILFGSWVVMGLCRLIWRGIAGAPPQQPQSPGRPCGNPGCRTGNPVHAHYCRRCGANLTQPAPGRIMNQPQPRFNPANGHGRQVARV